MMQPVRLEAEKQEPHPTMQISHLNVLKQWVDRMLRPISLVNNQQHLALIIGCDRPCDLHHLIWAAGVVHMSHDLYLGKLSQWLTLFSSGLLV